MKYIPRVSSKQIAEFLEKTLTTTDIKWAVRGYKNQKNKSVCPMCGQSISDKQAIAFFDKLGKYVSQNKDDNLNEYSKELNVIATKLESLNIGEKIDIFVEIVNELNDNNLLLKRETDRLQKGLAWTLEKTEIINNLVKKIYEKAENPYMDISYSFPVGCRPVGSFRPFPENHRAHFLSGIRFPHHLPADIFQ